MFARLCRHVPNEDRKREYSRSSDIEYQSGDLRSEGVTQEGNASYKENGCSVQTVDLVADCPLTVVTPTSRSPSRSSSRSLSPPSTATYTTPLLSNNSMGQRTSALLRPKISLTWVLRGQQQQNENTATNDSNDLFSQNEFTLESKEVSSKRSLKIMKDMDIGKETTDSLGNREKKIFQQIQPIEKVEKDISKVNSINVRTIDNSLDKQSGKGSITKDSADKNKVKRAISEPTLINRDLNVTPSVREKRRHRRTKRAHKARQSNRFGYEIADLEAFLTKASIEKPANIPVVLSFPSVLYQTQGGTQDEMALPLGTVVNAIFKNQAWLYVQTPHGQEGYVGYSACLPLGILPQPTRGPCWEDTTDVFPRPLGNLTDSEKLRDTRSECSGRSRSAKIVRRGSREVVSICGERSVDRLYLRATANVKSKGLRHTLLVIHEDYTSQNGNDLSVAKGDVVVLISDRVTDWFLVRSREGKEGFIPAVIAGNGYL